MKINTHRHGIKSDAFLGEKRYRKPKRIQKRHTLSIYTLTTVDINTYGNIRCLYRIQCNIYFLPCLKMCSSCMVYTLT